MERAHDAPASPDPGPRSGATRMLRGLAFVLLLLATVQHVHHAWRVITFPYDLDNGEAFVLNQAVMIARGTSPWTPIDEEPYLVSNFAPLYQTLLAVPVRFGQLSFAWGRSLSALATFASALLVLLIVRRLHGAGVAPAVAALLFLSSKFVYDWTALHRTDALALALSLGGLYAVVRGARLPWAGLLFALALLTRQTSVFAPAAAFTWLALRGRGGDALRLASVAFGVPVFAYAALGALTGGEFLRHAFLYNVQPWSLALMRTFLEHWVWYHPAFLAIGLLFAAWRISEPKAELPAVYLAFGAASFFLGGRLGAASNYMFDLVAALAIVAGGVAAWALQAPASAGRVARWLLFANLSVQALVSHLAFRSYDVVPTPDADDVQRAREVGALVAGVDGELLAEDAGWLLLNGRPVTFEPYMMSRLADEGAWDPAPILRKIAGREYAMVLLNFDVQEERSVRFHPGISDAIRANYRPFRRIPGPGGGERTPSPWWNWRVYVPRPDPAPPPAS